MYDNSKENCINRNIIIDISKALGIFLVVIGHTNNVFVSYIYQFHMPLFFFLSGYVFKKNKIFALKNYIFSKIKKIYFPFVITNVIFMCMHNFFSFIYFYTVKSNVKLYYVFNDYISQFIKIISLGGGEQLVGPLWYLIALFEITILFAFFLKILRKYKLNNEIYIFALSLILYFIGCNIKLPRTLSQSFIGMLFYCMGYIYKNHENELKIKKEVAFLSLILIILINQINEVDMGSLNIHFKLLFILTGFSGIYMTLYFAKLISNIKLKKHFILYCGKHTMTILIGHCICFKLVMFLEYYIYNFDKSFLGRFPVYQVNVFWSIPMVICGICIPLLVNFIYRNLFITHFYNYMRRDKNGRIFSKTS